MRHDFDVIVVGVGTMGSACCAELAKRDVAVLGLERFDIPNAMGAHGGHSRMFRLAYYEHPDYVPLLQRSLEKWRGLNERSGQAVFTPTGGLYAGAPDGELVPGSIRAAEQNGLSYTHLDRAEIARRFPQFRLPDHFTAIFEPDAGFIDPQLSVNTCASEAIEAGAELRGREPIVAWESGSTGVRVHTARRTYSADTLVMTGGAWTGKLVEDLGVRLTVTRQILGWVSPADPSAFALDRFPCWAVEHTDGHIYYGFPMTTQRPGLKIARHWQASETDPDTINRDPMPGDEDELRVPLREIIPLGDGPLLSQTVCMYTNTPDSHFIIDRHPKQQRVIIACGFSGHGFKFAPIIGEALADLAANGATDLPIGFLALSRFVS